jgi:hypothetical protein
VLPLRDTSHWLEVRTFGLVPQAMRAAQLALYAGGVLAFRGALRRCLGPGAWAEATAWLFALHPLHVESVAWLAGRKVVLGLLFVGAALYVYTGQTRHRIATVPALLMCAKRPFAVKFFELALCRFSVRSTSCNVRSSATSGEPVRVYVHALQRRARRA